MLFWLYFPFHAVDSFSFLTLRQELTLNKNAPTINFQLVVNKSLLISVLAKALSALHFSDTLIFSPVEFI
jgi:hypothetical protein